MTTAAALLRTPSGTGTLGFHKPRCGSVGQLYKKVTDAAARLGWPTTVGIALALTVVTTTVALATIVMLPANHFMPCATQTTAHPIVRLTVKVAKNLLGCTVILLGLFMALPLVPGPGLVFLLVGLSLVDFPGKRKIEVKLLQRPAVNNFINSLRRRFGKPPFQIE